MSYTCKITVGDMGQSFDSAIARLKAMGIDAVWDKSLKNSPDEKRIAEQCHGYDFVIAANERWGAEALHACKDTLKLLVRYGIGADSVDVTAASANGIPVTILPGCNAKAVAEQTVALMLDCQRLVSKQDREVRNGDYEVQTYLTHSLYGKTVGLLGFGNIAKNVVQLLQGFGCRFLAYDVYEDHAFADQYGVHFVSAEQVLCQSDIVSIHMPSTEQTHWFINRGTLAQMKRTAVLINTARGGLVCTEDLITALQNGVIAAAGLDVYGDAGSGEHVSPELTKLENVVLTRHSGANTYEALAYVTDCAIAAIDDFLHGRPLRGILNPDVYTPHV